MRVFKLKVSVGGFLFFLSSPPQTTQCPSVLTPSQMTALFQRYLHFKATQSGLSTHVTLHRMNEGSPSIPQKKCSMLIGCLYPTPQDSQVRLTRDDNVYSQSRHLLLWAEVLCGAAVLPESSIDRGRAVSRMIRWNESSPVKRDVSHSCEEEAAGLTLRSRDAGNSEIPNWRFSLCTLTPFVFWKWCYVVLTGIKIHFRLIKFKHTQGLPKVVTKNVWLHHQHGNTSGKLES